MGKELALLEPQTIDQAMFIAEKAVASRMYAVQSPEAALMILMTGRDLGLSASQAFRGIYVVSGKPVVSSDVLVAAVRRSGLCASWRVLESTAERCVITTLRQGEQEAETETWTSEDAKRAGLTNKEVWRSYPRDMLRHRTAAALARRVYPDVVLGCYDPGEMPERASVSVIDAPAASAYSPLDALRDDLASVETVEALRTVYEEHRGAIAEMDVEGDALKQARDACHAVATKHGWARTKADTDRLLGKGSVGIDVPALVVRYEACATVAEVDGIAAEIKGAKIAKEAKETLLAAHDAAMSRIYCADASAWDARLAAAKTAHEVANMFLKRADAFEREEVLQPRWERTAERLAAMGITEPAPFVDAVRASAGKRAA